MIEKLRNQERLSAEEENRIEKIIRICILSVLGAVICIILWGAFQHRTFGKLYYATIIILIAIVWFVQYVLSAILKHSLAGRTDEQVSAYLKAAGFELAAYAGLGWFLLAMNGNAIFGAVIYMIGVTAARKQKEIYYGTAGKEDEQDTEPGSPSSGEAGVTDVSEKEGDQSAVMVPDSLPSAADRLLREEKEPEDGSV